MGSTTEGKKNGQVRIFIADDYPLVRAGLKALIDQEPDLKVVGEGPVGKEIVAQVSKANADLIVLDLGSSKSIAMEAARNLKRTLPDVGIVALSLTDGRANLKELFESGVQGYALKRSTPEELTRAVRAVSAGKAYIDPAVAGDFIRSFISPPGFGGARAILSDREIQVLRLVAEGYGTKEVAGKCGIGVKSVETYKARSMEKLGLKTRVDIIRYARQAGWFER